MVSSSRHFDSAIYVTARPHFLFVHAHCDLYYLGLFSVLPGTSWLLLLYYSAVDQLGSISSCATPPNTLQRFSNFRYHLSTCSNLRFCLVHGTVPSRADGTTSMKRCPLLKQKCNWTLTAYVWTQLNAFWKHSFSKTTTLLMILFAKVIRYFSIMYLFKIVAFGSHILICIQIVGLSTDVLLILMPLHLHFLIFSLDLNLCQIVSSFKVYH